MENFTGYVGAIDFFTNLIDIADSSASEFDNLKTIPVYYGREDVKLEYYARLMLKRSCQEIIMRLETTPSFLDLDFLYQLATFENLTSFKYLGYVGRLSGLNDILQDCSLIKILLLEDLVFGDESFLLKEKKQFDAWLTSVTKVESLKFLRISSTCHPNLIEFLPYKYPNIKTLEFKGESCSSFEKLL